VGPITIVFGCVMVVVGLVAYGATQTSYTALIPSALGLLLIVCGALALKDNLRKHAMHTAALIGTVGLLGGLAMLVRGMMREDGPSPWSAGANGAMVVVCGTFVGLCVKSFIDARRQRQN
jgi:uncharacterized membrane protein